MSVVERLLNEQKEREARRNRAFASVKELPVDDRCTVAIAVIAELPPEDLHKVVAQLIRHVEKQVEQTEIEAESDPKTNKSIIAELPKVASSTPSLSTAPKTRTREKKTQRDFICEVITMAGRAMGTGEIGKNVLALAPELKFTSVKAEVQRMRKDGILIVESFNGRGGLHRFATDKERIEHRMEHLNGVS